MLKYANDLRDDSFCFRGRRTRRANDIYICMREFLFVFTASSGPAAIYSLRNAKFYRAVYAVFRITHWHRYTLVNNFRAVAGATSITSHSRGGGGGSIGKTGRSDQVCSDISKIHAFSPIDDVSA